MFQLFSAGAFSGDITEQVLQSLLTSVHMHGQHDFIIVKLLSCLLSVYELLRPQFADNVTGVMLQVPGVTGMKLKVC